MQITMFAVPAGFGFSIAYYTTIKYHRLLIFEYRVLFSQKKKLQTISCFKRMAKTPEECLLLNSYTGFPAVKARVSNSCEPVFMYTRL